MDHVSYLRGKHAFKFGFEFLLGIADNDPYNFGNGSISFKTLQNFLLAVTHKWHHPGRVILRRYREVTPLPVSFKTTGV